MESCIPCTRYSSSETSKSTRKGVRVGIEGSARKVIQELAQRRFGISQLTRGLALRDYEFRVADYTNQLLASIDKNKGKPFNISDWFNFYSFDVMGDLAFGKSFGMLKEGIKHYFMTSLHQDMQAIGMFSHMLWLFPIFKNTPVLNENNKRFWKFVTSQVDERIAV